MRYLLLFNRMKLGVLLVNKENLNQTYEKWLILKPYGFNATRLLYKRNVGH